jgi:GNAT superfamily N-acetyltransferase
VKAATDIQPTKHVPVRSGWMRVEETVTYLEMTSPGQLVPARAPDQPVDLEEVDGTCSSLVRSVYDRIGAPHGWIGRAAWTDGDWRNLLSRPEVRTWIAYVSGLPAGMIELEAGSVGGTGISVLGLVPEMVGRGFGGHLLTRAAELAWGLTAPDGSIPKRVWVRTSSRDHPHALPNYERRGFRAYRTENRQRELPAGTPYPNRTIGG